MLRVNIKRKAYKGKMILKNINFTVKEGEMVLILAPSGCGKSTLLKSMLNYTDYYGTVEDDNDCKLVYVQQGSTLNENERVFEAVYYTTRMDYGRVPENQLKTISRRALQSLGIWFLHDSKISKISGGQARRVQICEALVRKDGSTFLLDEPTTGLDSWSAHRLIKDLRDMAREEKKKIIVVSHDTTPENLKLFSKILVLAKDKDDIASVAFYDNYYQLSDYFGEKSILKIMEKIQSKEEGGLGLGANYIRKYNSSYQSRTEERKKVISLEGR